MNHTHCRVNRVKTKSAILMSVMALVVVVLITACSGNRPSGTYYGGFGGGASLTFSGNNFTLSEQVVSEAFDGENTITSTYMVSSKGTFEINGSEILFIFDDGYEETGRYVSSEDTVHWQGTWKKR